MTIHNALQEYCTDKCRDAERVQSTPLAIDQLHLQAPVRYLVKEGVVDGSAGSPAYSGTTAGGEALQTFSTGAVLDPATTYYGKMLCGTNGADGIAILRFRTL